MYIKMISFYGRVGFYRGLGNGFSEKKKDAKCYESIEEVQAEIEALREAFHVDGYVDPSFEVII